MNISLQKQIDLLKKAIIQGIWFDNREEAEECATPVLIEYLHLLREELSENENNESKLLTYVIIELYFLSNHKIIGLKNLADYIFEYLNLLQDDSKPLTVDELLKTINKN